MQADFAELLRKLRPREAILKGVEAELLAEWQRRLLDVDTVVLGGIYAPLARWLAEPVSREIAERAITSEWAPVTVRASALGTSATVIGAAGSVVRAILDAPATHLPRRS